MMPTDTRSESDYRVANLVAHIRYEVEVARQSLIRGDLAEATASTAQGRLAHAIYALEVLDNLIHET